MAVTDTHFVKIDGTVANDIPLARDYTHTLIPQHVQVPPIAYGPKITIAQDTYTRTWSFKPILLTRAQHDALVALAVTETTTAIAYPALYVMESEGTPNTWDNFVVDILSITDTGNGGDVANNRITSLSFGLRGTSGGFTMVVDSGGANAVTLYLDGLESISQAVGFLAAETDTGDGQPSLTGPSPITASLGGWCATGSLDALQKTLDAKLAVEMVGLAMKTTGTGYFATELPSTATAYLTALSVGEELGAMAHVGLTIVHDRG